MIFRYLRREWMAGLLLASLFLAASQAAPFSRIDGWLLSFGQHLIRTSDTPLASITVVDLDKASLAERGGMAGERMALADALETLLKATPHAVGILMPMGDRSAEPALQALDDVAEQIPSLPLSGNGALQLRTLIEQKRQGLDSDQRIAKALSGTTHSILALHDKHHEAADFPLHYTPLPDGILRTLHNRFDPFSASSPSLPDRIAHPDHRFVTAASAVGWLSLPTDSDGRSRSFQLAHGDGNGQAIAGMPLLLSLGGDEQQIAVAPGQVRIGEKKLHTDAYWRGFIRFYDAGQQPARPQHLNLDTLLADDFDISSLNGKVVLIADPNMLRPTLTVEGGHSLSIANLIAIATANLLHDDLFQRTDTLVWAELLLFLFTALLLVMVMPRLRYGYALALAAVVMLLLAGGTEYLLLTRQLWLKTALPLCLLSGGMLLIGLRRLYAAQAMQHRSEVARALRQLGLSYQEQNKLELAFEAFQKLPPTSANLETLYNLALDFERRRRYERAVAVYRHILNHDHGFKDATARKLQAEKMERSLSMNSGQFHTSVLLIPDEDGLKPQLGRYEVEKELGRGAMGAVYLGRDPKIGRAVAIKTLALSQEFEAEELQEVESRFFHEAAAAGRLNHPNIVTIHDAGEEHDLAYIAMEFIDGKPLSDFLKTGKLLPLETVLNISAQVAGALDYACKQGVVHRDIKPGNIMYNEESGQVKIADFGIARITSSSHTRTGAILGTPSYMSPEQISSRKVDGRSDIFSLGSTLFALLTGKKPFTADSIAALTYQITSEKHPDVTKMRDELPTCVKSILDKALQKDPDKRYQDGMAMRRAILRCLKSIP